MLHYHNDFQEYATYIFRSRENPALFFGYIMVQHCFLFLTPYLKKCIFLYFRLNYHHANGESTSFHIVNIFLHSVVTWLFTSMCQNVFHLPRETTVITGLLFALHPVHTEAVSIQYILYTKLCHRTFVK